MGGILPAMSTIGVQIFIVISVSIAVIVSSNLILRFFKESTEMIRNSLKEPRICPKKW
jgi:hypothetical protein